MEMQSIVSTYEHCILFRLKTTYMIYHDPMINCQLTVLFQSSCIKYLYLVDTVKSAICHLQIISLSNGNYWFLTSHLASTLKGPQLCLTFSPSHDPWIFHIFKYFINPQYFPQFAHRKQKHDVKRNNRRYYFRKIDKFS